MSAPSGLGRHASGGITAAPPAGASAHASWSAGEGGAANDRAHAVLAVEGLRCASCSGKLERALRALPGVSRASVNAATGRAAVAWNPQQVSLKRILASITAAGFRPVPLAGEAGALRQRDERRRALKRLGLAGLAMMQTMMVIYALYAPGSHGIAPHVRLYLRVAGMLFATPVMCYSAAPFFRGAILDLRRRTLGMDVPVALALALAYGASVFNTLRGAGEVYFDSVTMFVFFLLTGRFMEMVVRHRSLSASDALARSLPASAQRLRADGSCERVAVDALEPGDLLLVPTGTVVPVDAVLEAGRARLDESLVTGEAQPVEKLAGGALLGGSVNVGEALRIRATTRAADSTVATLVTLLERAQAQRPALARSADRIAAWFVSSTLVLAAVVAAVWLHVDPPRAFPALLAVLVVTCPCALSLATPAAAAAVTACLARLGVLVSRPDAIERLAHVDTVVIDKTGTLTSHTPSAELLQLLHGEPAGRAWGIAAALERGSQHPLAAAFRDAADPAFIAEDIRELAGQGIEGQIGGRTWRLGRPDFVAALASVGHGAAPHRGECPRANVVLGSLEEGILAHFRIADGLRPDAARAVAQLRALGLEVVIASGDEAQAVQAVGRELGIEAPHARLDPQQKVQLVRSLQQRGACVLMVGDGINDGPVLAAADVSAAMGEGSAIAHAAADLLLLSDSLVALPESIRRARRMLRVVRENLAWALLYNLTAVPLAALGRIPAWAAALGMSVSSLLVVLNSARLARRARVLPVAAAGAVAGAAAASAASRGVAA